MMRIKLLKQSPKAGRRNLLLLIIIAFLLSRCCNNNGDGFNLQRFEVKNIQLDSIITTYIDSVSEKYDLAMYTPLLVLHNIDSTSLFYFTTAQKESIAQYYIFMNNRRIIGYVESKNADMIILSTINSLYGFEEEFYRFILPANETKYFDYIYFPDDMYWVTEDGRRQPPTLFDPVYKLYWYKGNEIVFKEDI